MPNKEELNQLFSRMKDKSNLIVLSQGDIDKMVHLGKEIRLRPKKNAEAKGAIIFVEGTKNLTLAEIENIAEKVTRPLPDAAEIIWGLRIDKSIKNNSTNAVYVY